MVRSVIRKCTRNDSSGIKLWMVHFQPCHSHQGQIRIWGIGKCLYAEDIQDTMKHHWSMKGEMHSFKKWPVPVRKIDGHWLAIESCLAQNNRRIITTNFIISECSQGASRLIITCMILTAVQNNSMNHKYIQGTA